MNHAERIAKRLLSGRSLSVFTLGLSGLTAARSASAQQSEASGTLVQARTLFDEGRQLMKTGDYAEACRKFEASDRIDRGVGTRFNLAECREKEGKTATAWALFLDIAGETKLQGDRRREAAARRRVAELEPHLARLTIHVATGTEQIELQRDGQQIEPAAFDVALPIDPGEHEVTATAPGHVAFRQVFSIDGEGKPFVLNVPILQRAPSVGRVEPPNSRVNGQGTEPNSSPRSGEPPLGIVYGALAVGAVGLGTGTYFAFRTAAKRNDLNGICPSSVNCSANELASYEATRSEAKDARTLSLVGFTAGGLGVATAVVVYLMANRSGESGAVSFLPAVEPSAIGGNLSCIW